MRETCSLVCAATEMGSPRDVCESAWGSDADRRAKLLNHLAMEGALLRAYSQQKSRTPISSRPRYLAKAFRPACEIIPERASSGPMRVTRSAGRLRQLRLSAHCFENSTNKPKRTRLSCQIANNLSQTLHLIASPGIGLRVAFSSFSTQQPGQ
jgi:hypothetical protein